MLNGAAPVGMRTPVRITEIRAPTVRKGQSQQIASTAPSRSRLGILMLCGAGSSGP